MPNKKTESNERKLALSRHLHSVAVQNRAAATELDQMAGRIEREVRSEPPFPCCQPGPCMICKAPSPAGHEHILLPGSRQQWQLPIGRICSSHTIREIAMTERFMIYIEGEADE